VWEGRVEDAKIGIVIFEEGIEDCAVFPAVGGGRLCLIEDFGDEFVGEHFVLLYFSCLIEPLLELMVPSLGVVGYIFNSCGL
jgi:hypothetical protein